MHRVGLKPGESAYLQVRHPDLAFVRLGRYVTAGASVVVPRPIVLRYGIIVSGRVDVPLESWMDQEFTLSRTLRIFLYWSGASSALIGLIGFSICSLVKSGSLA